MSPYVDKFVLGYSDYSYSGKKNSNLTFLPFENDISFYRQQIFIYHIDISDIPLNQTWEREGEQRNRLINALPLLGATGNDLIFCSDTDEVPYPEAIEKILATCTPGSSPVHIRFDFVYYNFRWNVPQYWARGFFMWVNQTKTKKLNDERNNLSNIDSSLEGIHMSYFFHDIASYQRKLRTFSHTEFSESPFTDPERIFASVACGMDLLHGTQFSLFVKKDRFFSLIRGEPKFMVFGEYPFFTDMDIINRSKLEQMTGYCQNLLAIYEKCCAASKNSHNPLMKLQAPFKDNNNKKRSNQPID